MRRSVHLYARDTGTCNVRSDRNMAMMKRNSIIQKRNYLFFEDTRIQRLLRSIQTKLGLYVGNTKTAAKLMKDKPILVALRTTKDKMMKRLRLSRNINTTINMGPFYAKHGRGMKQNMNRNMKRLESIITRNVQRKHTKLRSLYTHRKSMWQKKSLQLLSRYSNKNIKNSRSSKYMRNIDRIMDQTTGPAARARQRYRMSVQNLFARARRYNPKLLRRPHRYKDQFILPRIRIEQPSRRMQRLLTKFNIPPHLYKKLVHQYQNNLINSNRPRLRQLYQQIMREQTPHIHARARSIIHRLKCMTRSRWNTILHQGRIKLRHRYKRAMGIKMDDMEIDMDSINSISINEQTQQQLDPIQIQHHAITIQEPFRKEWFSDIGGYPLTSKDPNTGRFCNPWNSQSTNGLKHFAEVWRWKKTRFSFTESFLDHTPKRLQLQSELQMMASQSQSQHHDDNDTRTTRSTCTHKVNGNVNHDSDSKTDTKRTRTDSTIGDKDRYLQEHPKRVEALASPSPEDEIEMTWIGHATNLIRIGKEFTVLTDPVFSHKASPFQMLDDFEFLGVPRFLPPSLSIQDLSKHLKGKIDVCVISHDHYDHLDWNSVQLIQDEKLVKFWAVPMGIKDWLLTNINGIDEDQIVEMEWWDSITFVKDSGDKDGASSSSSDMDEEEEECSRPSLKIRGPITNIVKTKDVNDSQPDNSHHSNLNGTTSNVNPEDRGEYNQQQASSELTLTCAPAQHWCSRTPFDRNTRLWCSWAMHSKLMLQDEGGGGSHNIETPITSKDLSFYFAGDTGYPEEFPLHRQIGDVLGPFDLASIPIGAYKPRFFMQDSHCDPNEAVQIHQDIRSKRSVAIHWGTFPLANESFEEPPILLLQAAKRAEEDFRILPHGHSVRSDSSSASFSTSSSPLSSIMAPVEEYEDEMKVGK